MDWLDLLAVQGTLKSLLQNQSSHQSSVLSLLYGLILTSIHDHWENHSFDYVDLCWQNDVSAFNALPKKVCRSFLFKGASVFNFMAVVTIHSDTGAQETSIFKNVQSCYK